MNVSRGFSSACRLGGMKRLFATTALSLFTLLIACSSSTSSSSTSGPACTGAGQGGACQHASDCKPAACKCTDGTGSDTATNQVCINDVCDAQTTCDDECQSHGGVAKFAVCS